MTDTPEDGDQKVEVNPAAFEQIMGTIDSGGQTQQSLPDETLVNLDMILDVAIPVTVCVGSVKKKISEILGMTPGHIIDLNRFAGDPVDLLANGKIVARGEVVVVDDHYGMRITEIVSSRESVSMSST